MSKPVAYITIYRDKVETSGKNGMFRRYPLTNTKFNKRAEKAIPVISLEIMNELYYLQDLGYEIIFKYGKEEA